MIGGLRKKFICISTISVFAVFSIILSLLLVLTRVQMNQTLDTLTDTIAANNGFFPEFDSSKPHTPSRFFYTDAITEETRFSTRFFTVWLNEQQEVTDVNIDSVSTISQSEVEHYASQAMNSTKERGWVSEYRYKITSTEDGAILVFVNGTMYKNTTNLMLFTIFLILLGSAVLILTLTVIISKRVVRPVAEGYEKQKQFITDANHELKTPLTLILSNLDILEAEYGKNEWLDDIRSEGERMGLLINQLVTLSRMDESDARLLYADFDLSGAINDTVSEFQYLAEERGHMLFSDIAPSLSYHGDEALIRKLAAILLDNAVKYCDAGGKIQVRLSQRRHPILTVENTYAEVDSLELERLFDRFYRADRVRTFSGSFGVGLSIAQSIVKSHRGTITAYKKEGLIGFRVNLK